MRNLIIMVVLMLGVSIMSIAQDVVKFTAGHAEITNEGDWDKSEVVEVKAGTIILTSTEDDGNGGGVITITNKYRDAITYTNEVTGSQMSDGHERTDIAYEAVDQDGVSLIFIVQYYEDGHLFGETYRFRFRFCYNNLWYGYYCNRIPEVGNKKMDVESKPTKKLGTKIV